MSISETAHKNHEELWLEYQSKAAQTDSELFETMDNLDDYKVIYLGWSNWWGTFPIAVFIFLETYDFSGKTILQFCTHEGS